MTHPPKKPRKNKAFTWQPPPDIRAILATIPAGRKAQAINDAMRAIYGQGEQAAKAHLKALLTQVER
jgi:hypothetical protein